MLALTQSEIKTTKNNLLNETLLKDRGNAAAINTQVPQSPNIFFVVVRSEMNTGYRSNCVEEALKHCKAHVVMVMLSTIEPSVSLVNMLR